MKRLLLAYLVSALLAALAAGPAAAQTDGTLDCGDDRACFIELSQWCVPARVTWRTSFNLFGMLWLPSATLELLGPSGDQCLLRVHIDSIEVRFTDALVEQSLAQGWTEEEIQASEAEANLQADAYEGMEATCPFPSAELASLLAEWRAIGLSLADLSRWQCAPPGE